MDAQTGSVVHMVMLTVIGALVGLLVKQTWNQPSVNVKLQTGVDILAANQNEMKTQIIAVDVKLDKVGDSVNTLGNRVTDLEATNRARLHS